MKITKRQLRRIIKEEKQKILKESPMNLPSLATSDFAKAIKGDGRLLKENYDPLDEMYLVLDHLAKAQMIAEEIVAYSERDPAYEEYGMPFFSFSNQIKKLMAPVGSQADKAYRQNKGKK